MKERNSPNRKSELEVKAVQIKAFDFADQIVPKNQFNIEDASLISGTHQTDWPKFIVDPSRMAQDTRTFEFKTPFISNF